MNLNLLNRHPSRRLPLNKWRKLSLAVIHWIVSHPKRYPKFKIQDLSIVFLNDREMAGFNWDFLKHEGPTDIITFDYHNGSAELLISLDTAKDAAKENDQTFEEELLLYIVHGVLHLAGFKDKTAKDSRKMRREERSVLKGIGAL